MAGNRAAIYTGYVQMMPSMDGFFTAIDRAMAGQSRKFAKAGKEAGKNFTSGFKDLERNVGNTLSKGLRKGESPARSSGARSGRYWLTAFNSSVRLLGRGFRTIMSPITNLMGGAGKRGGYSFAFNFVNMAKFMIKRAMVGISLIALSAIPTQVIAGGLTRALNMDKAKASLKGLGYSIQAIEGISKNALTAVEGTVFGLDQSVKVASTAIAAGVPQGDKLTKYLKSVADAATIAGTDMEEMGTVYNKIMANGTVWSQELNMVADRGIPIFAWLAEAYGVSQAELRKMVEDGKVQSDVFFDVMENKIGGAALAGADTAEGAFLNMRTAMSKLGESFWKEFFPVGRELFLSVRNITDAMTKRMVPALQKFTASFTPKATANIKNMEAALVGLLNGTRESAGLTQFINNFKLLKSTVKEVWEIFKNVSPLYNLIEALKALGIGQSVQAGFEKLMGFIVDKAPTAAKFIKTIADQLALWVPNLAVVATNVKNFFGTLIAGAKSIDFAGIFNNIVRVIQNIIPFIAAVVDRIVSIVSALLPHLIVIFTALGIAITTIVPHLWDIGNALLPVLPVLVELFASLLTAILPIVVTVANFLLPLLREFSHWVADNASWLVPFAAAVVMVVGAIKGFIILAKVIGFLDQLIFRLPIIIGVLAKQTGAIIANSAAWVANKVAVGLGTAAAYAYIAIVDIIWGKIIKGTASVIANTAAWVANKAVLIASRVAGMATAAWMGIVTAAQWAWNAALLANPIGLIIAGIAALVAGLIWFFTQTKLGQDIWKNLTKFIGESINNIGKWLGDVGRNIGNFFAGIGNAFANMFKGLANFFIGVINNQINAVNWLIGLINSIQIPIPEFARALFGGAKSIGFNIGKIANIPALATGANVMGPTVAMVGEKKPETVTDLGLTNRFIANTNRLVEAQLESKNGQPIVVNLTVNPSEGMSERELARKVTKQLFRTVRRQ